jgi:hypothetical protein
MTQLNHTRRLALMEEAITVLFCLVDDAYAHLNPNACRYESLKRLSDSEVITHNARALPAASRDREPALVLARHRAVLLTPVPRDRGAASLLFESTLQEAAALLGALAAGRGGRAGR